MTSALRLSAWLVLAGASTFAQGFENRNFEQAVIVTDDEWPIFQEWSIAAPFWNHSAGADTNYVYYGAVHVGQTQWYRILDTALEEPSLQGRFSLAFASGFAAGNGTSPWVNAFLSQSVTVPTSSRSLQFLATGPLAVSINGVTQPHLDIGGGRLAVGLDSFAGQLVEVRFVNTSLDFHDPVVLDGIAFSTSPVPEPAAWLMFSLALCAAPLLARRSKRSSEVDKAF
jgi:hypothetical protein